MAARVERVKRTDPITAFFDGRRIRGHVVWLEINGEGFEASFLHRQVQNHLLRYSTEGVAWVRGHVAEDDPLWQALLTVNALRGQVPDLEENSRRFVAGEISQTEWSRNVDLWDEALARGDV